VSGAELTTKEQQQRARVVKSNLPRKQLATKLAVKYMPGDTHLFAITTKTKSVVIDKRSKQLMNATKSKNGDVEKVRKLLSGSSESVTGFINGKDQEERTALHRASEDGKTDLVQLLLERGADIEATENQAWTPLHTASNAGNTDVVQLLLDRGQK
jgi:hypothetical protein